MVVKSTEKESPLTPHLTEEIRAALSAPLDPKFLKSRKGQGGKLFTYAEVDYLEDRATEVDPDWGAPQGLPMFVVTDHAVVCNIQIHSVSRSATAGYFIPQTYEVSMWNPDIRKRETHTKEMTSEVAHTIVTRAQAAAQRRVFAMFGLGAELWRQNQEGVDEPIGPSDVVSTSTRSQGSKPNGPFRAPSPGRISLLVDMGVPEAVAQSINSESHKDAAGKFMKDDKGNPISDVSEVINALFKARGQGNKGPVDRRTWENVISLHAPYALSTGNTGDSDDDADDEWAS